MSILSLSRCADGEPTAGNPNKSVPGNRRLIAPIRAFFCSGQLPTTRKRDPDNRRLIALIRAFFCSGQLPATRKRDPDNRRLIALFRAFFCSGDQHGDRDWRRKLLRWRGLQRRAGRRDIGPT